MKSIAEQFEKTIEDAEVFIQENRKRLFRSESGKKLTLLINNFKDLSVTVSPENFSDSQKMKMISEYIDDISKAATEINHNKLTKKGKQSEKAKFALELVKKLRQIRKDILNDTEESNNTDQEDALSVTTEETSADGSPLLDLDASAPFLIFSEPKDESFRLPPPSVDAKKFMDELFGDNVRPTVKL